MRRLAPALLFALLAGCGAAPDAVVPTERVAEAPAEFWLRAEGELKAAKATPLRVPGRNYARRQLVWMLPDGSPVKAGELVARFEAVQSQLELDKALLDLQRNALAKAGKSRELEVGLDRIDVELAQAEGALAIAQRYARADFEAIARNTVLDAVEDEGFLREKSGVLRWRQDQSAQRGEAELDVLAVQRGTLETNAADKRSDLEALELRAPHDGIFMLVSGWSGQPPQIGEQLWAGGDFANLPDLGALEVELNVPQQEAQGLALGQAVQFTPLGHPDQHATGEITWIASAPRATSRQSPAKFLSAKASVPIEAARRYRWVPGQAFELKIIQFAAPAVVTLPNLAIAGERGQAYVMVLGEDGPERREVELGVRGPARTEVKAGLRPGERVLLAAAAGPETPATGAPATAEASP